jgi:hypothetical protein
MSKYIVKIMHLENQHIFYNLDRSTTTQHCTLALLVLIKGHQNLLARLGNRSRIHVTPLMITCNENFHSAMKRTTQYTQAER